MPGERNEPTGNEENDATAMYVCICNAVTERQILNAVDDGATTLRQLSRRTGCSTQCGSCTPAALEILREARQANEGSLLDFVTAPQPA